MMPEMNILPLKTLKKSALLAKDQGLAGVMTWDINRDCDQRMNYPQGQDNLYQTGQPRGSFINILSKTLNAS